ncbi:MAG: YkgJ family cysteine cluster protein [Desulfobacterium sp.]|jgi:Fe-S-cluster containining protein|nr:YkgJ family cysteine cluster protein [Desulfobacterium sp.]
MESDMESGTISGADIFDCTQCGQCCAGFGGTYVNNDEIRRIAAFMACDPGTFTQQYCDRSGSRWVITQGTNGSCIFFDKNCTIHPVKPYMCRAWPFLKTIIKNPENWEAMAKSCPGMRKGVALDLLSKIAAQEVERLDASYYPCSTSG